MYQKIVIVGNLGGPVELRFTPQGSAVASFSVATNRRWTGADGQPHEEVTWFRVSVWNKQAEACNKYLTKGSQVMVEGRLSPDKDTGGPRLWTKNDGTTGASYELQALTVQFLGSKSDGEAGGQRRGDDHAFSRDDSMEPNPILTDDQIPF